MITDRALMILRSIVQVAMTINVFLLVCEIFTEFYAGGLAYRVLQISLSWAGGASRTYSLDLDGHRL